jgi:hypothetical protein
MRLSPARRFVAVGVAWLSVGVAGLGADAAGNAALAGDSGHHETYFPHINPHRPRPLDPLRYLLQSLWLLATRVPEPDKKVNWRSLAALEGVHGRYTQWLENCLNG